MQREQVVQEANEAIEMGLTLEKYLREDLNVPDELLQSALIVMEHAFVTQKTTYEYGPSHLVSGNLPQEVASAINEFKARRLRLPVLAMSEDELGLYIGNPAMLLPVEDKKMEARIAQARADMMLSSRNYFDRLMKERSLRA